MNESEFFYPHHAIVKRGLNDTDDDGNEMFEVLYDGMAGLQIGVNGDETIQGGIYQKVPTLIIPVTDTIFLTNDHVVTTTANGEQNEFTVRSAKTYEWDDVKGTTLWLKKGTGL